MIDSDTVATAAPTPDSVSVERNIPIADKPATPTRTYAAAPSIRTKAAAPLISPPDSVGIGP